MTALCTVSQPIGGPRLSSELDGFDSRTVRQLSDAAANAKKRRQVLRIADNQWWFCFHCDTPITPEQVTRDHLIPKCKGGKSNRANIVASCAKCNSRKGDKAAPPRKYIEQKQRQYYRSLGVRDEKPHGYWRDIFPNFGKGPDGARLWAPQFGIV